MPLTQALPASGSTSWYAHYADLDKRVRSLAWDGYRLDDYTGTDDQKLTSAIADQQADTAGNMRPIVLPNRPMSFNQSRQMYSGLKIIGNGGMPSGQKNPEVNGGGYAGSEAVLGSSIGSGASSWWHNNANAVLYNVYMGHFQVNGDGGASRHQFIDNTGGNLYACAFEALAFNMMRSVFGDYASGRKCLITQVSFPGNWTVNNCWNTPFFLGGSDALMNPDMMNIGVSKSTVQTGNLTRYFAVFDSLEIDLTGKIYISTMNAWRGVLISGASSHVNIGPGTVIEGYKPTRIDGLYSGPGHGSQLKITGGSVGLYGVKIGQGMDNPDASENGLVDISGGEVSMFGCQFYGQNMATANAVTHTGGRLYAAGIRKRQNENGTWSNRPRVATTATAGTGAYTFSCPDQSVQTV